MDNLNYTNLTYTELKQGLVSRMSQDPRFSNFTESELNTVLLEIFAATTDFTNYYIGRRAEESFLDSAKLRSSVVMLSKMLGYVVQRPIPSTTSIQVKIKSGTLGQIFTLPKGTSFSYNGNSYVLKDTISYTITQDDVNNFATDPSYVIILEFYDINDKGILKASDEIEDSNKIPVYLIQGEFKTFEVAPTNNNQLNTRFQTYKIFDKDFSNVFGTEDYGYDNSTGYIDVTSNYTRVGVGENESEAFADDMSVFGASGEFYIDRRSFLNDATINMLSATGTGATTKYCVVRTAIDDNVEILFADDSIGKIGPKNNESLFVRYFSTKGSFANEVGAAGKMIQCQSSNFGTGFGTANVDFYLRKNITGGADKESIESIKVNSPGIFYSLDRCVSSKDYVNFLKTLTSPINVKNAIAWGEQEETKDGNVSNLKMFNVVLFSILGEMYHKDQDVYTRLSNSTDSYTLTANNQWFNLLVASDSVTPLRDDNFDAEQDVGLVYSKLKNRSQVTVKNVYISPIIKDLKITGYIYLNPLADRIKTNQKITDAVYGYLNENADFDTSVYISKLIEIIESFSEVKHADIKLISNLENYQDADSFYVTSDSLAFSATSASYSTDPIGKVYNSKINEREVSSPELVSCYSLYLSQLSKFTSAYSDGTKQAIIMAMPGLETKTFKIDPALNGNQNFVRTELVWPSNNIWNKKNCSYGSAIDSSTDIITNFVPSERNFYIGMMKCVYEKLKSLGISQDSVNTINEKLEAYYSNSGQCIGCSLRTIKNEVTQSSSNVYNSNPIEIQDFLDTNFEIVCDMFRNSFINSLQNSVLDAYSNASLFSMKNEIVRIKAPDLSQYVYYK